MGHTLSVFVMRHGIAESGAHGPDENRQLTDEGRHALAALAAHLLRRGVRPDCILASPCVRTQQTAELMQETLAPKLVVRVADVLAPGASAPLVVQVLRENFMDARNLLLVGHMPDVGGLVAHLLLGQHGSGFCFSPGSMARVDFYGTLRPGTGMLKWMLMPEQCLP